MRLGDCVEIDRVGDRFGGGLAVVIQTFGATNMVGVLRLTGRGWGELNVDEINKRNLKPVKCRQVDLQYAVQEIRRLVALHPKEKLDSWSVAADVLEERIHSTGKQRLHRYGR